MKLKKCFTVIMLMLLILLASCAGENARINDGTRIARGYLTAYSADDTRRSSIKIADEDLMEFYLLFSEGHYVKRIYGLPSAKPYVSIIFEKEDENGEYHSTIEYIVLSNDKVSFEDPIDDTENGFRGKLPGAYEKALSYIADAKNEVRRAALCTITAYDAQRDTESVESAVGKSSEDLFDALDGGDYVSGNDRTDVVMSYITVRFEPSGEYDRESGYTDEFRVYEDDYVIRRNVFSVTGWLDLGHFKGAYGMLVDEIEHQRKIYNEEVAAGFSFDSIMIQTSAQGDYEASDFPEIDCLRVSKLIDDDVTVWWTLVIDSESAEDTLAAAEMLKTRSDVKAVCLNYIMTLD